MQPEPIFQIPSSSSKLDENIGQYLKALVHDVTHQFGMLEAGAYSVCALMLLVGYHMYSDGIFSSIVTLASVLQLLGLTLTMLKIQKTKSFGILSMTSLQLYVPVYILRLSCTLFNEGYLPIDCSGDWAYQTADILSLVVVLYLLFIGFNNKTVVEEAYFPSTIVVVFCLLLAYGISPCHNLGTWSDVTWTASVYLETFVMLPQLRLVSKQMSVESLTSHSIACTAVYRGFNFYFWWVCRKELIRTRCPSVVPSYFVVGSLALQCVFLLDFMFYYLRGVVNQTSLMLPTFDV